MPKSADPSEHRHRDRGPRDAPLVGIGASAGGVSALETFFEGLPPDPKMSFVVVTHLSPDRESNLIPLLQRHTDLEVQEASHGITPEANVAYVLPPNSELRIEDGQFQLHEATADAERSSVIDTFFRSLADDQEDAAIGIVLSGSGTDGTLGLRALKEKGAFVMVQSPDDAAHEGMPRSALSARVVDVKDSAEALGANLPGYWTYVTGRPPSPEESADEEEVLSRIFARLHAETGHDFSRYKRATVLRRIQRRMAAQRTPTLSAYLETLSQNPEEVRALFRELLIGVTECFRDPEAFEVLEDTVIPSLFEGKAPDDQVRVWSAGCATGEEAYSLAMLLDEYAAILEEPPDAQVFATDPSPSAIAHARKGRYPESIVSDLSGDRRTRHLRSEGEYYQVRQPLRDRVLFAEHDLLQDPPFPRIDLISCRNVLIYLQRSVHERVLRLFHYVLQPGGYLFLGPSESVSAAPELFSSLDAHSSLLRRQATEQNLSRTFSVSLSSLPSKTPAVASPASEFSPSSPNGLDDLHRHALAEDVASLLVNQNREIVHLTASAAQYLRYQSGAPTHDVLEAVPKVIRTELRGALRRAFREGESTGPTVVETAIDDDPVHLALRVRPLRDSTDGKELAQVLLHPTTPRPELAASPPEEASEEYVEQLEAELRRTKEQLQTTIEEYETTTEELESANEELLSMNEELQLQNEEIETSKEELQSVNEELKAANRKLKTKVSELRQANARFKNLKQATNVATLFLDRDLRVEWFSPRVREHFNIRETDTGRPLSDFTKRFHYGDLLADAQDVLDTLQSVDREIQDDEGRWFLARMRPYRTLDDEIEGVVITFVDITDRKTAEMEAREEHNFVNRLLDTVGALVVVLDTDYRIVRFNEKCESVTGYAEDEVEGESVFDRLVPEAEAEAVRALFEEMEAESGPKQHEHHWISREGSPCLIRWSNTTLTGEDGTVEYLIGTGVDVTWRRQLEREVIAVSDKERQRIGQDLHDILASHLTGTALIAQEIARRLDSDEEVRGAEVREISDLIKEASEQARKLSRSLMPLEIQEDNLAAGLENLARREEKASDVTCTFEAHGSIPALDQDVAVHLYRIASEAVSNAIKHGDPDRIEVRLEVEDDVLALVVRDDGSGFSPDAVPASSTLGLNLMRYRSDLIGAHLEVESTDGEGTRIRCSLSIDQAVPPSTPPKKEPSP